MISRTEVPVGADHVIGAFTRDTLSAALVAIHRAGFGPQTRVLDGARSNVLQQLARAGLIVQGGSEPPGNAILVVVTAPGRASTVTDLIARLGAESIHFASRQPAPSQAPIASSDAVADIRIGDGAASDAGV